MFGYPSTYSEELVGDVPIRCGVVEQRTCLPNPSRVDVVVLLDVDPNLDAFDGDVEVDSIVDLARCR